MTPPMRPHGRVALISGASRGIGLAIARELHAAGWRLSLGVRTGVAPEGLEGDEAQDVQIVSHDARRADEAAWVAAAEARFGRIDAVVCSAGVMIQGNVLEIAQADLDTMWQVNVLSPRRLIAAAWPALRATGFRAGQAGPGATGGRVVILGSLSGLRVKSAASAPYAMTKHAAVALGHGVRQVGHAIGIRATVLCPGFVDTDMARAITDYPPDRMTRPADVAAAARLALDLPDTAALATLPISCQLEELY